MKDSIKREQSKLAHSAERENLRPKGKKIINPWRNHEGYNCFGCSPDNPIGLHMEFYEDGDYIVSTWHPEHNYQGWVDTMHVLRCGTEILLQRRKGNFWRRFIVLKDG